MFKRIFIYSLVTIALCISTAFMPNEEFDYASNVVYKINIMEEIGPSVWRKVKRAIEAAEAADADYIFIHMNTYGGMVDMADSLRTKILNCKIPVIVFIDNNAASAGALISIACDRIYMRKGGNIGAATVVNMSGEEMPDKYQSYMRSMMRSTAEVKNRDPKIAEAMVDERMEIEGITEKGQVLTFTASEAKEHGFCDGIAENIEEVLREEDIYNYRIEEQKITSMDKIIGWLINPAVSGFLIMIIIGGIYFELQTPGVGFPLIAAIIAAVLYFAPHYLEGMAANWEIFLFFMGVILLALEVFLIPGFGIAGLSGIIAIVASLTFSLVQNDWFDFTLTGWEAFTHALFSVFVSIGISMVLSFFLGKYFVSSKFFLSRFVLQTTQDSGEGYQIDVEMPEIVGKKGTTVTVLRPSGKVEIDGEHYDANTEGGFVEAGEEVKVIRKESGHIIVRKV